MLCDRMHIHAVNQHLVLLSTTYKELNCNIGFGAEVRIGGLKLKKGFSTKYQEKKAWMMLSIILGRSQNSQSASIMSY